MTVSVWRIATDAKTYLADDMTGTGAGLTGGRWNSEGRKVTYCASNRALACLETTVHLNAGGLPLNRYLVEISIPDDIWSAAEVHSTSTLSVGWDAEPASKTSMDFGDEWLRSARSALLVIPSVIVPEELNVLINPDHSDSGLLSAKKIRKWLYDPRLLKGP